jgi:predicted CXXCH cytochrome family protein
MAAEYAGSAACRGCHAKQHKSHSMTGMAKMFAAYSPQAVFGDFSGTGFEGIRPVISEGRHAFEIGGKRLPVDYTIGSKWQQAYATRAGERIHVFPIQYNRLTGRWLNYWREIDPPGSIRTRIDRFTEFSDATLYQRNCAPCHTSQLRQAGTLTRFAEPGVNCEMCHGPSAGHVERRLRDKPANEPPVDFRRLDAGSYVQICGQCHRQSAILRRGAKGELNYSGFSPGFPVPQRSRPFLEFSRRAFYPDGRFRETTFIVEAFERSSCYRKGGAHCGNCHDPHPADFAANLKSLKHQDDPDAMCSQCHRDKTAVHTRHKAGSEASRCVSCHMPRITETVGFKARTHTISDIPNWEAAARFGAEGSPNACLMCHGDRDAGWLRARLTEWRRN